MSRSQADEITRPGALRLRSGLAWLHRIIGLIAGAIFVLMGLSGAILAFREDIDELLNTSIMRVETPAQPSLRSIDDILAA
ncbi:MAG: PepSY domain-containing protein, partial [Methylocystis sp.]|nr:PepSY domain-containing protein [Methylocystis sp.]